LITNFGVLFCHVIIKRKGEKTMVKSKEIKEEEQNNELIKENNKNELIKLKAIAFDLLVQQQQINQNLQAVNQQIIDKQKDV
jgi:hypothetical protein